MSMSSGLKSLACSARYRKARRDDGPVSIRMLWLPTLSSEFVEYPKDPWSVFSAKP